MSPLCAYCHRPIADAFPGRAAPEAIQFCGVHCHTVYWMYRVQTHPPGEQCMGPARCAVCWGEYEADQFLARHGVAPLT